MTFDWFKIGGGALGGAVLCGLLVYYSGFTFADWAMIDWTLAALCVVFSVGTVSFRALNYALYAPRKRAQFGRWLNVGARHQALFSLIPSGLGDLGFPILAKRHAGAPIGEGAAIIGVSRIRDILVLAALFLAAMPLSGKAPWPVFGAALAMLMAATAVEPALRGLSRRMPVLRGRLPGFAAAHWQRRGLRTAVAAASWVMAGIAVWCAFRAARADIQPSDAVLLLGGLNAAGFLAVTAGGLGVTEVGAAVMLIWFGIPTEQATRIALTARPLLLVSVVTACFVALVLRGLAARICAAK